MLGVMDEVDLLPGCLEHLYRIGVETVLARDGGSSDGSLELLRSLEGDRLRVVRVEEAEIGDPALCSLREAEAARSLDADWVLFLDADERWLPAAGSLHECAGWQDDSVGLVQVQRFNVALMRSAGPALPAITPDRYAELQMFARAIPDFARHLDREPLTPWITGVPVSKFAARPQRLGSVDLGWHGAQGRDGAVLGCRPARDAIVAHLPFTTASRFRRKVENIKHMFATHPDCFPPGSAWHWRRWSGLESDAAIEREFELQCLSDADAARLAADGSLRSAADLLESLR